MWKLRKQDWEKEITRRKKARKKHRNENCHKLRGENTSQFSESTASLFQTLFSQWELICLELCEIRGTLPGWQGTAFMQPPTSVKCSLLLLSYKGIGSYDTGLLPKSRCMHHPGKLWFIIARSRMHSRWAALFLARATHWLIMRTAP